MRVGVRDGVSVRVEVSVLVNDGVHVSVGKGVSEAVGATSDVLVGVRERMIPSAGLPKITFVPFRYINTEFDDEISIPTISLPGAKIALGYEIIPDSVKPYG